MPLYEYECPSCQKVHEVMQKFSDAPMVQCPECHGPVTKLVSLSSFSLKGSGWYTTDYKRAANPPPASEKAGASTKDSSQGATVTPSSDSAPGAPASGAPTAPSVANAAVAKTPAPSAPAAK